MDLLAKSWQALGPEGSAAAARPDSPAARQHSGPAPVPDALPGALPGRLAVAAPRHIGSSSRVAPSASSAALASPRPPLAKRQHCTPRAQASRAPSPLFIAQPVLGVSCAHLAGRSWIGRRRSQILLILHPGNIHQGSPVPDVLRVLLTLRSTALCLRVDRTRSRLRCASVPWVGTPPAAVVGSRLVHRGNPVARQRDRPSAQPCPIQYRARCASGLRSQAPMDFSYVSRTAQSGNIASRSPRCVAPSPSAPLCVSNRRHSTPCAGLGTVTLPACVSLFLRSRRRDTPPMLLTQCRNTASALGSAPRFTRLHTCSGLRLQQSLQRQQASAHVFNLFIGLALARERVQSGTAGASTGPLILYRLRLWPF